MERDICINWQDLVDEAIKRRKLQGLTQEQFATFLKLSKPTLIAFEAGKTSLSLENALKILVALGLSVKPAAKNGDHMVTTK